VPTFATVRWARQASPQRPVCHHGAFLPNLLVGENCFPMVGARNSRGKIHTSRPRAATRMMHRRFMDQGSGRGGTVGPYGDVNVSSGQSATRGEPERPVETRASDGRGLLL